MGSAVVVLLQLFFSTQVVRVNGILGGSNIDIQEAPYQVNYGDQCGGVLIHTRWAITTAHCGNDSNFIRVGSKSRLDGFKVKIIKHIAHPNYGYEHEFDYDIQLLKLKRALRLKKIVNVIKISQDFDEEIEVAGWGYKYEKGYYSDTLYRVSLPIVSKDDCQQVKLRWYNNTLTDRMFCAGGGDKDACQGDSGGAAVSFGRLVGIASFGFGCGRKYPGVYVNVSHPGIMKWLWNYIRD